MKCSIDFKATSLCIPYANMISFLTVVLFIHAEKFLIPVYKGKPKPTTNQPKHPKPPNKTL